MDRATSSIGASIITTTVRAKFAVATVSSLQRHHPDLAITVVVIDDRFREVSFALRSSSVSWFSAGELLGLDRVTEVLAEHENDDAVTVLSPELVSWALHSWVTGTSVMLLTDHVMVRRPLWPLFELVAGPADQSVGFVRVRDHLPPVDGRLPDATDLFAYGRIQRCVALFGSSSHDTVQWWRDQLAPQPFEDPARFDRVSHCWFDDLVFPQELSMPTVKVAPAATIGSFRNADSSFDDAGTLACDFDGFDPNRPWALSELSGNWPRVLLSEHTELAFALRQFADDLQAASAPWVTSPYDLLANGHRYDPAMRRVYVEALRMARRETLTPPPNPFVDSTGFVELLSQEVPGRPTLSRHLAAWKLERPDLAHAFEDDDVAFWKWAESDALAVGIWTPLRRQAAPSLAAMEPSASPESSVAGINVVGLLSAQLGVGEHGRLALRSVRNSSIPFSVIDHDDTIHHRDASVLDGWPKDGFRFDIDMLLVNADQTRSALHRFQRPGHPIRPTIGLWAWEAPVFPERYHEAYQFVSEVWVLSEFVQQSLVDSAQTHHVNVEVFPLPLPYVRDRHPANHYAEFLAPLGVDTKRPFVSFMFDYFSVAERKQPWRAIEAFIAAFPLPTAHGPQLVIKSMNDRYFPVERERTHHAARGRSDIVFVEQYLEVRQRDALVSAATGYLSLHRSEGFGLTLAEAMGAGTPCIATAWSGNLDFMTPQNSFLVDVDLVDIPLSVPAYAGMGQWAEPSVEHASRLLQQLFDEPDLARARATQAVQDLQNRNQSGADAQFVIERVRHLRHQHSQHTKHAAPVGAVQGALR